MILLLALAAAAATTPTAGEQARFDACVTKVQVNAARAAEDAVKWRAEGGGVLARQCEGLAYAQDGRWAAAAAAFENAAREAERKGDGRATPLWVQAGNAALAAADYAGAGRMLTAALARGQLRGDQLGEAYLDRARASAAISDMKGARADLDLAIKHVPADPLAWLLSAALARRVGDLSRAETDIGEALKRAPDDSSVALEAGYIALAAGRSEAARTAFEAAVRLQPISPSADLAKEALKTLH